MAQIKVVADGGSPKMDGSWYLVIQKGDTPREHRKAFDKVFEINEELYNKAFPHGDRFNAESLCIGGLDNEGKWRVYLGEEDTGEFAREV